MKKIVISLLILAINFQLIYCQGNDTDSLYLALAMDTEENPVKGKTDIYDRPYSLWDNNPDYKRIGHNTLLMVGGGIMAAGILYALPEGVSNWDKESMSFKSIFKDWWNNVSSGPVVDNDDFFLNYVTHPYCGALYYMGACSAGASAPYSFLYSFLLSTFFWEYGIEAFTEVPSVQDLIVTPVFGSLLGEGFYLAKRKIVANDYRLLNSKIVGHTATFLMDPLNEVMDLCTGKFKNKNKENNLTVFSHPYILPSGKLTYTLSLNLTF
ncbi:MAG: DUF3943 domain-containing protein [Candidatus Azobacteroides sp.]|nr:DUF3943 domain-containing protein [Candidatus Azobacteroides sp.]